MEELRPDSLSDDSRRDPAMLAAWAEGERLLGSEVYDVNGQRLGRVTRCFAEEGALLRCDVSLSPNAQGILGETRATAGVSPDWIARVEEGKVYLNKAGEQLVRPDDPRGLGASPDERGAPELPRKNR